MALVLGDLVQFRNLEGRVVVNLSCSTLVRRIAEALGCRVTVKPVGFKYIAAEMKKGGVLIGGEEAGVSASPRICPSAMESSPV